MSLDEPSERSNTCETPSGKGETAVETSLYPIIVLNKTKWVQKSLTTPHPGTLRSSRISGVAPDLFRNLPPPYRPIHLVVQPLCFDRCIPCSSRGNQTA